jgi:tetratricopeptide (TPR) repeat protein
MTGTAAPIFISHSSKDDAAIARLRQALGLHGVDVWVDSRQLTPGDLLTPAVEDAIEKAPHFFVVLSPSARSSKWVMKEVRYALKVRKKRTDGYKVIPILLDGFDLAELDLWFPEEPIAERIDAGPGGIMNAMPGLLAALGLQLPNDPQPSEQPAPTPMADLVLELSHLGISTKEKKRRATAEATLRFCPADGSPEVESEAYTFVAPLGPIEAEELRWYLEKYPSWPSDIVRPRAEAVEENLPKWGQSLYAALTEDVAREAFEAWKATADTTERRFTVFVDPTLAKGSSAKKKAAANEAATLFLALPWELAHDGRAFLFQGKHGVRVRRRLPNREKQTALSTGTPLRVLLVSPRPEDERAAYIDHRVSARPLVEALLDLGPLADFKVLSPPTFPALREELGRASYHVVHFDGHGVYDPKVGLGALCFEHPEDAEKLEDRRSALVNADELAAELRGHRVPLVFLEACQTAVADVHPTASVAGSLLQCGVASVAAMSHSVLVETARRFVGVFYRELVAGRRVGTAMLAAQHELKSNSWRLKGLVGDIHLQDWFVPVLFQEESDPRLVPEMPADRARHEIAKAQKLLLGDVPPSPPHGFFGRSRELLKAERLVEQVSRPVLPAPRHIVLRGDGGEGKTTLAAELARWLVATRRFSRAVWVTMEGLADARAALFAIGTQLVPDYVSKASQSDAIAWQLVERALEDDTVIVVFDNMESVLPPAEGSEAASLFDADTLKAVLALAERVAGVSKTRVVFTTREAMPAPFAANEIRIGRLDRKSAVELVAGVLRGGAGAARGASDQEIEALVDAVGCHARSLQLLAGEVARSGVPRTTEQLVEVMRALHKRYPNDRERSLIASAELSLRRLPDELRQRIRPLAVYQGGGSFVALAVALKAERDEFLTIVGQLVDVGLAQVVSGIFLQLDPALGPALMLDMSTEEVAGAREVWAENMKATCQFLYHQQSRDPRFAYSTASLELPNLLGALQFLDGTAAAEELVDFSTSLESLTEGLGKPQVIRRVEEIRTRAAGRIEGWNNAGFNAERAAIDRLLDARDFAAAVARAERLVQRALTGGETAFEWAAYDIALSYAVLGRVRQEKGDSTGAMEPLVEAQRRFKILAGGGDRDAALMANAVLTELADCYRDLGWLDEAASSYEEAIRESKKREDLRSEAVNTGQLATVRLFQRRHADAIRLYEEARDVFEKLGQPESVAIVWNQLGMAFGDVGNHQAAENALQRSLAIKVSIGNAAGQGTTLIELGNLYGGMARPEDAVLYYRRAAELYTELGDNLREGVARNNAAPYLTGLHRYDEARAEIQRAFASMKPYGHVAEPWKRFDILCDLERAVGNIDAAKDARKQAIAAYLAYRRDGGQDQFGELPSGLANAPESLIDDLDVHYALAAEWLLLRENPENKNLTPTKS